MKLQLLVLVLIYSITYASASMSYLDFKKSGLRSRVLAYARNKLNLKHQSLSRLNSRVLKSSNQSQNEFDDKSQKNTHKKQVQPVPTAQTSENQSQNEKQLVARDNKLNDKDTIDSDTDDNVNESEDEVDNSGDDDQDSDEDNDEDNDSTDVKGGASDDDEEEDDEEDEEEEEGVKEKKEVEIEVQDKKEEVKKKKGDNNMKEADSKAKIELTTPKVSDQQPADKQETNNLPKINKNEIQVEQQAENKQLDINDDEDELAIDIEQTLPQNKKMMRLQKKIRRNFKIAIRSEKITQKAIEKLEKDKALLKKLSNKMRFKKLKKQVKQETKALAN